MLGPTVLHCDSLRNFFVLVGHKLPVLCLDISSDGNLLISGSADKTIKIWGLDFGDCHKSLFAHDDSVTGICFVPETHYAFSCSKDKRIRYWDIDRFELLMDIGSHHANIWALVINKDGDRLYTAGTTRS